MPEFSTNIRVSASTYERLRRLKREDESFDAVLQREIGES